MRKKEYLFLCILNLAIQNTPRLACINFNVFFFLTEIILLIINTLLEFINLQVLILAIIALIAKFSLRN